MEASSGEGRGAEERLVIDAGQTLVINMSTSCEEEEEDWMAARDL